MHRQLHAMQKVFWHHSETFFAKRIHTLDIILVRRNHDTTELEMALSRCRLAHLEVINKGRWRAAICHSKLYCHEHLCHWCNALLTAADMILLYICEKRVSIQHYHILE